MSDADLHDTVRRLEPVLTKALQGTAVLPEHAEEARTLLAMARIELRRRQAVAEADRLGWCG